MCCFSQAVTSVSNTNIFARSGEGGLQFLAYQMQLDAKVDLAMVLPLPVPHGGTVRFINLEKYPEFFTALTEGVFPAPQSRMGGTYSRSAPLEVVSVGSFDASFVPTVADFSRLDARFRLPAGTWEKLPQYKDWGFAVFKLKPGSHKVHPMAFEFPRRHPRELFFPTVHIHDGKVHAEAEFDHTLFCQHRTEEKFALGKWAESSQPASTFMEVALCQGLVNPAKHVYGLRMKGELKNEDTVLSF